MTLVITTTHNNDSSHNDTRYNDTRNNNTHYNNIRHNDTYHNDTQNKQQLTYCFTECCYQKFIILIVRLLLA